MTVHEYLDARTKARAIFNGGDQGKAQALFADLRQAAGTAANNLDDWADSIELGNPDVNFRDVPFASQVPETVANLESAGLTTITVSSTSTGLLEFLEAMTLQGWVLEGMRYVTASKYDDKPRPAVVLSKR